MPLQKSFSDTNHSTKSKGHRPAWTRNKSMPAGQAPKKPLQEKPPVPVSTATKNKLSNFQFGGQTKADKEKTVISLVSDDEKENEAAVSGVSRKKKGREVKQTSEEHTDDQDQVKPEGQLAGQPEGQLQKLSVLPKSVRTSNPSTPAGKLAMDYLTGMEEIRRTVDKISPAERIEWDIREHTGTSPYGGMKKNKKRARSSSPAVSSPSVRARFDSPSAQVDPGSELWGRYSLTGSNVPTPQGPSNPTLAHIMHTSSPQPLKEGATPRSAASLRRASSCGNQFPKRRRVGGYEGDNLFTEPAMMGPSRLSVLIERVQEGLTQPPPQHPADASQPTSSSQRRQSSEAEERSSMQQITQEDSLPTIMGDSYEEDNAVTAEPETVDMAPNPPEDDESDYGDFDDDDLDADLMEEVFSTHPQVSACRPTKSPAKAHSARPSLKAVQSRKTALSPPTLKESESFESETVKADSYQDSGPKSFDSRTVKDEFDDSDDEMFSASLEDIVSQFDGNQPARGGVSALRNALQGAAAPQPVKTAKAESDDEFGDDGLDDLDFEVAEATATQSIKQSSNGLLPSTQRKQAIQRYLVTNVLDFEYETKKGRKQPEKILLLQIEQGKSTKAVHLRGGWIETPVTVKAFVHVIGTFDAAGECIVDDNNNMLILHPDHLISSTVVADSFGCIRRAVLQDRLKSTSESSAPLIYGTILHEIFQAAMLTNRWDTEWLVDTIETIATRHLEDLYTIRLQIPDAVEYLKSKMPELQAWAELFVSSKPKPQALVKAGNGQTASMCVSKLLDVEEHVWSPMYGLKGNIDATVQVVMKDEKEQRTLTVPFEVKTGKNPSAAHRAQTALYNLLLSDRYDIDIAYGILYYMETSETIRIPAIRHELRHMIMQRNELACYVRERQTQLPPMLKNENMCNRCYAKVPCFIYQKFHQDSPEDGVNSRLQGKFDEVVKHLMPKHKEFFLKWDDLLTKEEKESLKFRRELWTMLSSEREKLGRCFSNVIIEPGSAYEDKNNPKINRYRYSMIKEAPAPGFSFLDSQIVVGEPIVISDEKGHFALANGYVTHVRKSRITVAVDRRLHNARIRQPGFDEVNNQVFASIMEVAPEGSTMDEKEGKVVEPPVKYRLDKDEFSNGMATVRNNLIQVMADGPFGSRHIRGLVVDMNAPRFKTQTTAYTLQDRENINVDQRRAIQKVMSAEDYALVLGMPGTGKTTTIAHIIRALVSQGKSVLLTSYTHTAVDNILLKLKDDSIPILRLGTIAKISTEVQEFATLAATTKCSFEEIKSAWHETPIVATTCLGINHAIFSERTFDYCIVDEASQITLPVCLGPIRLARTFILVGDHYQLPPLVQNEEARVGGLDISLFKLLSDTHPNSVVYLEHQYRMCADVMALSNNLIYNGRLKCGSPSVASRTISIPNLSALSQHHFSPSTLPLSKSQKSFCPSSNHSSCWLTHLIKPSTKVSFINTDPLLPTSLEQAKGNRIVNPTEAILCTNLVSALLSVGIPASSIGVMTHYRSQLSLLKHHLRASKFKDVEMHTADRFQGRDKEVIILSLVRSNENKSIGELLKDWRRINVAFTRAKTKLLVVGSKGTLGGMEGSDEMVARFVRLMEEKDWMYDLPRTALEDHFWGEEGATQSTVMGTAEREVGSQWCLMGDSKTSELKIKTENEVGKKRKGVFGVEGKENASPAAGAGVVSSGGGVSKGKGGTGGTTGNKPKVLGVNRQPNKKIMGQKPFKIPKMSVLGDVVNDVLY